MLAAGPALPAASSSLSSSRMVASIRRWDPLRALLVGFSVGASIGAIISAATCIAQRRRSLRRKAQHATAADKYYGEVDRFGLPHGEGIRLTSEGIIVGESCGRFSAGSFVLSKWVQRKKLPRDTPLGSPVPARAEADLLHWEGGWFIGEYTPEGLPQGHGTQFYPDGSILFKGTWKEGFLDGADCEALQATYQYRGGFVSGKFAGIGEHAWVHGGIYDGQWVDGNMHGYGILFARGGQITACGKYINDSLTESTAVPRRFLYKATHLSELAKTADLILPDGGCYIGGVHDPIGAHDCYLFDGEGCVFNAAGEKVMRGQFKLGQMDGEGWVREPEGGVYQGTFVQGARTGLCCFTWPDGVIYEGEFEAGKRHGFGIQWDSDGSIAACGVWQDHSFEYAAPVPRCKLPRAERLSEAEKGATLLYPRGGYYCGSVNDAWQRHGAGSMFDADGEEMQRGIFARDRIQVTHPIIGPAPISPQPATRAAQSSNDGDAAANTEEAGNSPAASFNAASAAPASSASASAAAFDAASTAGSSALSECVICRSAPRDCLIDCPHFCMCMACAERVDVCPVCRSDISTREFRRIVFT